MLAVDGREGNVREDHFHGVHHLRSVCLLALLAVIVGIAACHGGVRPVIDLSTKPAEADGTISGTVRGPEGTTAIEGRSVEVINVDTGERQHGTTNNAGGFTFKVKPGKYRVEVALQEGEVIVKRPDVINVNRSDVDAHADFVLAAARVSRPRNHAPRSDDGLGSASA